MSLIQPRHPTMVLPQPSATEPCGVGLGETEGQSATRPRPTAAEGHRTWSTWATAVTAATRRQQRRRQQLLQGRREVSRQGRKIWTY